MSIPPEWLWAPIAPDTATPSIGEVIDLIARRLASACAIPLRYLFPDLYRGRMRRLRIRRLARARKLRRGWA